MLRTPIPRSFALGSSLIHSTRYQKQKTPHLSGGDPWEICFALQGFRHGSGEAMLRIPQSGILPSEEMERRADEKSVISSNIIPSGNTPYLERRSLTSGAILLTESLSKTKSTTEIGGTESGRICPILRGLHRRRWGRDSNSAPLRKSSRCGAILLTESPKNKKDTH